MVTNPATAPNAPKVMTIVNLKTTILHIANGGLVPLYVKVEIRFVAAVKFVNFVPNPRLKLEN